MSSDAPPLDSPSYLNTFDTDSSGRKSPGSMPDDTERQEPTLSWIRSLTRDAVLSSTEIPAMGPDRGDLLESVLPRG